MGAAIDDVSAKRVSVVHLSARSRLSPGLRNVLEQSDWQITEHFNLYPHLKPKSVIFILDKTFSPVLTSVSESQWQEFRRIILQGSRLLWIAEGSQVNFTKSEIMAARGTRGIDVILNSLNGELLDESWRICADGGKMVEIGKRDIVDRNFLAMEPFDRNCSFHAINFSYSKQIKDPLGASLLEHTFKHVSNGHLKAIHPITVYPSCQVPAVFAFIRSGRHIGKIVRANEVNNDSKVLARPPSRAISLEGPASYMIVGGLKGLCGSLAIYLAKHGAKNIVVMSRSGCSDEKSRKVIMNCNAFGCGIQEAAVDVTGFSDVKTVFQSAKYPVAGVIQGPMVLRDKRYQMMTVSDFHTTLSNKVAGTWNLHHASLELKQPPSFFTLLSSVSGVIGQKDQANYSAANTFLDAFASFRLGQGLPAHSVNLGVIEDVGYVAEQG